MSEFGDYMNDGLRENIADICGVDFEDVKGDFVDGYTIDGMPWQEWHVAVNES